jgi:FKBP-type peptidyl-prolyl cis-trans isomerase 2
MVSVVEKVTPQVSENEAQAVLDTEKAHRNEEYWAKIERALKNAEAGNVYSFEMEDLEAFAARKIDKYQLLERAK